MRSSVILILKAKLGIFGLTAWPRCSAVQSKIRRRIVIRSASYHRLAGWDDCDRNKISQQDSKRRNLSACYQLVATMYSGAGDQQSIFTDAWLAGQTHGSGYHDTTGNSDNQSQQPLASLPKTLSLRSIENSNEPGNLVCCFYQFVNSCTDNGPIIRILTMSWMCFMRILIIIQITTLPLMTRRSLRLSMTNLQFQFLSLSQFQLLIFLTPTPMPTRAILIMTLMRLARSC
jgi:hypothetical protein